MGWVSHLFSWILVWLDKRQQESIIIIFIMTMDGLPMALYLTKNLKWIIIWDSPKTFVEISGDK